ncbi:MAG TPA: hypothetical protein VH476_09890 [Solirubrobacterales bacterium]|jgi:hypothetical protein
MSRPQSYSHVLASFVAEAAHDARAASRDARSRRRVAAPKSPTLRRVSFTRSPAPPEETLKPAA